MVLQNYFFPLRRAPWKLDPSTRSARAWWAGLFGGLCLFTPLFSSSNSWRLFAFSVPPPRSRQNNCHLNPRQKNHTTAGGSVTVSPWFTCASWLLLPTRGSTAPIESVIPFLSCSQSCRVSAGSRQIILHSCFHLTCSCSGSGCQKVPVPC